ncbi:MAG: acyltransferase [Xanthobacteraceae bacterium]|nr:acyltransferase [Xanthobacteraceae bacterium]
MYEKGEIRALTGLRGIAAFGVALTHINQTKNIFGVISWGDQAVDLFFCLSAFTLCLVYGAGERSTLNLRDFFVARFARVYPLYALLLLISGIVSYSWSLNGFPYPTQSAAIIQGLRQVFMINALPVVGSGIHWNPPMWSLSIEAVCYVALFPLLFVLSGKTKDRPLPLLAISLLLIVVLAYLFVASTRGEILSQYQLRQVASYFALNEFIVRGVLMFTAGWLAYLLALSHEGARKWCERMVDYIALAMIIVLLGQATKLLDGRLLVILMPWLIIGLQNPDSRTARFLSTPAVHFLGVVSYSIYLIHWPLMDLTTHFFPELSKRLAFRLPFELIVLMFLSGWSYRFVEAPARRIIRRSLGLKKPVAIETNSVAQDVSAAIR